MQDFGDQGAFCTCDVRSAVSIVQVNLEIYLELTSKGHEQSLLEEGLCTVSGLG